jgi:hypothetical protein
MALINQQFAYPIDDELRVIQLRLPHVLNCLQQRHFMTLT